MALTADDKVEIENMIKGNSKALGDALQTTVTGLLKDFETGLEKRKNEEKAKEKEEKDKADKEAQELIEKEKKKKEDQKNKTPEQIMFEEQAERVSALENQLKEQKKETLLSKVGSTLTSHAKGKLVPGVEDLILNQFMQNGRPSDDLSAFNFSVGGQSFSDPAKAFDTWLELPDHAKYKAPPEGLNSPDTRLNRITRFSEPEDPFTVAMRADNISLD